MLVAGLVPEPESAISTGVRQVLKHVSWRMGLSGVHSLRGQSVLMDSPEEDGFLSDVLAAARATVHKQGSGGDGRRTCIYFINIPIYIHAS